MLLGNHVNKSSLEIYIHFLWVRAVNVKNVCGICTDLMNRNSWLVNIQFANFLNSIFKKSSFSFDSWLLTWCKTWLYPCKKRRLAPEEVDIFPLLRALTDWTQQLIDYQITSPFPPKEDLIYGNICRSCDFAVGLLSWGLFVGVSAGCLMLVCLCDGWLQRVSDQDREPGPFSTGPPRRQSQPGCLANPAWWVLCSGNRTAESAQTVFHLLSSKPLSPSEHVCFTHKGHETTAKKGQILMCDQFSQHTITATAKFTQVHFNIYLQTSCDCCRLAGFISNMNNDTNTSCFTAAFSKTSKWKQSQTFKASYLDFSGIRSDWRKKCLKYFQVSNLCVAIFSCLSVAATFAYTVNCSGLQWSAAHRRNGIRCCSRLHRLCLHVNTRCSPLQNLDFLWSAFKGLSIHSGHVIIFQDKTCHTLIVWVWSLTWHVAASCFCPILTTTRWPRLSGGGGGNLSFSLPFCTSLSPTLQTLSCRHPSRLPVVLSAWITDAKMNLVCVETLWKLFESISVSD